jgi:hypothetical protein
MFIQGTSEGKGTLPILGCVNVFIAVTQFVTSRKIASCLKTFPAVLE